MGNLGRNIQFGLRTLLRNKGFSAIAMLVLALGIGPNVAIFSIVWATFLAPLPYPKGDELVVVWNKFKGERIPASADDFLKYRAQATSFESLDLSAWKEFHFTINGHQDGEVAGGAATPNFYTRDLVIGTALGRGFVPEEGIVGNDHVVIFSYRLWEARFHADAKILGKQVEIEGQPYTVVGVQKPTPGDRGDGDFRLPLALNPGGHNEYAGTMFGRLKQGTAIAQAQAEMAVIDSRIVAQRRGNAPKDAFSMSVEPLHNDWLDKKLERNLWLLLAAVGFVLLIACANLANLLLARGSSRQQELAVRSALGARRAQVFAQLLTESVSLAILGGTIGIALGWAMMKTAMVLLPDLAQQNTEASVEMNLPVLCFAIGVTLIAGILSGCAPAWQAARLNLSEMLKQGSRSVTGRGRIRTQAVLVVAEFALALTLLAGAGMALHSFWNLTHVDLGVRTDHILMGEILVPKGPPPNPETVIPNANVLLAKVGSLPGVLNAALATSMPLEGHGSFPFSIAGRPVADKDRPIADLEIVTPSYFNTFGVELLRGRFLMDSDRAGSPQAVMVSESFASRYFQGVNPLEQTLLMPAIAMGHRPGPPTPWWVVGVFHSIRNGEHLNDETAPEIFAPLQQIPLPYLELAVRTALDPSLVSQSVRNAVAETMPGYSLTRIQTMQQVVDAQLTGDRFGMVLFGAFAVLALLLAALGIYGVMAFAVAQRRHEIGLRMALGAQRGDVVRMILLDGMRLALAGSGIGLAGVYALGRVMHSTLYGVNSLDIGSFAAVTLALLAVAFLASWLPARRSAKIDPMIALRQE